MKIATWNVNGIRARYAQLEAWLAAERPDVVCLQEIKATPDRVPAGLFEPADYWCYWHGAGGYSGVALLVRRTLAPDRPDFVHPDFDVEQRVVAVRLPSPDATVVSMYVPNGGKDFAAKMRFLESMDRYALAARERGDALVICGDLNVARTDADVHPKERKANAIGQRPDERALFERILSRGLVDVARALHPDEDAMFTWWAPWRNLRQRNVGWRIDYILASEAVAGRIARCEVAREVGTSDHAPVVAWLEP